MIPLSIPDLSGNEAVYLQECVTTGFVSSVGPFVGRLERLVAEETGSAGAVATSCGTTGLHVALVALGVGRDDLVIAPSFTFIASVNAISHCGAQPWLLDVERTSWGLDPEILARVLAEQTRPGPNGPVRTACGRRIGAIVPVHVLGTPPHMEAIVAIARRHGIPVLADAAAAIGATYEGRPLGQWGADLSVLSFNGNKTVTSGGGGAVFGCDQELLDRVRHLSTTARVGSDYLHDAVGYNYRMTNLQAAVGCAQMERAGELVAAKRRIRVLYDEAFAGLAGSTAFPQPNWGQSGCWFSGLVVDSPATSERLRAHLRANGIDARPFWRPAHLQPPYADAPRTPLPVTEDLWQRVVTLPCSTNISPEEIQRVIDTVCRELRA